MSPSSTSRATKAGSGRGARLVFVGEAEEGGNIGELDSLMSMGEVLVEL